MDLWRIIDVVVLVTHLHLTPSNDLQEDSEPFAIKIVASTDVDFATQTPTENNDSPPSPAVSDGWPTIRKNTASPTSWVHPSFCPTNPF